MNNLLNIQKVITRGTKVVTKDGRTFTFDGFDENECPHKFCMLHPRNSHSKKTLEKCQGMMKWTEGESDKIVKDCPIIGGDEFTINTHTMIKYIIKDGQKVKPENYA
jgi:hypothetical protein